MRAETDSRRIDALGQTSPALGGGRSVPEWTAPGLPETPAFERMGAWTSKRGTRRRVGRPRRMVLEPEVEQGSVQGPSFGFIARYFSAPG